ncbi:MAG: hypothetical protein ABFD91_06910 [Anaerohalosphaeraceae bacterium]
MKKITSAVTKSGNRDLLRVLQPVAAVLLLSGLAVYLYQPHWFQLGMGNRKILLPLNSILAAMGCFVVTRRWISSFDASLLAAIIYGFGSFGLSFIKYHFMAGLCYAMVPWLLCPAVYYHAGHSGGTVKTMVSTLLTIMPFAAILGLIWFAAHHWAGPLFLMPKHRILEISDLLGLVTPMIFATEPFAIGFYHVPLILMLMGLFVFAVSGRETLLLPVLVGIVLSLMNPILDVTPILWLSFPALFLSVLAGLGLQAMAWAGKADRFWITLCIPAALILAGVNLVLSQSHPQTTAYSQAAVLFLAAAGGVGAIFLMTCLNIRMIWLRWVILFGLCVYDIVITSPSLVDSLF